MSAADRLWDRWVTRGETQALGQLFDRTSPGLRRMAQHLAPDLAAADDALQSTFLAALERPRDLGEDGRVEAWLAGILVHQVRRQRRDRARDRNLPPHAVAPEAVLASAQSPEQSPAAQLSGVELESRVTSLLANLSPIYAEPLRRRLFDGDSPQSIALELGLSLPIVHKRLSRGLKKLRKLLPAALATPALGQGTGVALASVRARVLQSAAQHHAPVMAGTSWTLRSIVLLIAVPCASVLATWLVAGSRAHTGSSQGAAPPEGLYPGAAATAMSEAHSPPSDFTVALPPAAVSTVHRQGLSIANAGQAAPEIDFQVISDKGAPLAGVSVNGYSMLEVDDDPESFREFSTVTDSRGFAHATVLDGKYAFNVNLPSQRNPMPERLEGFSAVEETLVVKGDHTRVVTLYPLNASLVVETFDDTDRPVAGIKVSVRQEFKTLFTDEMGRAVFDGLHQGEYSVYLDRPSPGFEAEQHLCYPESNVQRVELRSGSETSARFVFSRTGSIRLRLVSDEALESLGIVTGSLVPVESHRARWPITLAPGETTLVDGLAPGDYRVNFAFPNDTSFLLLNSQEAITVVSGEEKLHTLRLGIGRARLGGQVVDAAGRTVPYIPLAIHRVLGGEARPETLRTTTTDESGQFSVIGLQPGEYTLQPFVNGIGERNFARPAAPQVVHAKDRPDSIEVVLEEAGIIEVTFPAGAHRYAARIESTARPPGRTDFTLVNGLVEIRNLPVGFHTLTLVRAGVRTHVEATVEVRAGETSRIQWAMP